MSGDLLVTELEGDSTWISIVTCKHAYGSRVDVLYGSFESQLLSSNFRQLFDADLRLRSVSTKRWEQFDVIMKPRVLISRTDMLRIGSSKLPHQGVSSD
jgi:hypothetical protein